MPPNRDCKAARTFNLQTLRQFLTLRKVRNNRAYIYSTVMGDTGGSVSVVCAVQRLKIVVTLKNYAAGWIEVWGQEFRYQ